MSSSDRRISDLISDIDENRLELRPYFQRRLVWTNNDKEKFIDTVLNNFPFPEIFMATGLLDLETTRRVNWLVDGQQRISTLHAYIKGSEDILCRTIPKFSALTKEEKTNFLDYEVAVRDLGSVGDERIKEIFQRINSTDYALRTMEKLNAMYNGAYSQYCEKLSRDQFFARHNVFSAAQIKRMYDVTFAVILVTTIISGYYRRDEKNSEYLERYNDEFEKSNAIDAQIHAVFSFIEECNFPPQSRAWKHTDLLTLIVEIHSIIVNKNIILEASKVGSELSSFFDQVDDLFARRSSIAGADQQDQVFRYLKAATKASNDKYSRVERAEVIAAIIMNTTIGKRIE